MNEFDKLIIEIKKGSNPSTVLNTFLSTPLTDENRSDTYVILYNILYNAELISAWHDKYSHAQFANSNINVVLSMMERANGKINDVCAKLLDNKAFLAQLTKDILDTKYYSNDVIEQINNSEKDSRMRLTVDKYTTQQFCSQLYFQKLSPLIKNNIANLPLLSKLYLPTFQKHGIKQAVGAMIKFMTNSEETPKKTQMFTTISREEVEKCGKDVIFNEIIKSAIQLEHTNRKKQNDAQSNESQRALLGLIYDNIKTGMLGSLIPCIKNSPKYLEELIKITVTHSIQNQDQALINQEIHPLLQYLDGLSMADKPAIK